MFSVIILFVAGVGLLVGGAWALVTGGVRLAKVLGVPSMLIGLTIVAWGTSAPELVVSLMAAMRGAPDMMLGNVMGSNVANVGLILGIAALVMKPEADRSLWKFDMPILLLATALFCAFAWDGTLSVVDGIILSGLFLVFTAGSIRKGMHGTMRGGESPLSPRDNRGIIMGGLLTLVGAIGMVYGGRLIVDSATEIAVALKAPEVLIGLTLVAVGTSLPELATTLIAALRKESGIALGNVVGSNLFNLLAVGGPVAILKPVPVDRVLWCKEIPSLVISTLALVFVMLARRRIGWRSGLFLLVVYGALLAWWII